MIRKNKKTQMTLQELVNKLSNRLASLPGDTPVHIKVAENKEVSTEVTVEETEKGKIIIIE